VRFVGAVKGNVSWVSRYAFDTETIYTSTAYDHAKTMNVLAAPFMLVGGIAACFFSTLGILIGLYSFLGSIALFAVRRKTVRAKFGLNRSGYRFAFFYFVYVYRPTVAVLLLLLF
jgi:hypothetical protein